MKPIKRKGGFVYLLEDNELCPPGEICFIGDEYEYAKKIVGAYSSDPEQTKSFWEDLFHKKQTIPGYVLFMDFPREVTDTPRTRSAELALKYGPLCIAALRGSDGGKEEKGGEN